MATAKAIQHALALLSLPEKKAFYPRFFKAGKGEYAEGDEFIGFTVPDQRKVAREYRDKIRLAELSILLASPVHEHRHTALLMLVAKYEKAKTQNERAQIVQFYLKNKRHINNWDLVDNSCYKILGRHAYDTGNDGMLRALAAEDNLWSKRIAIVSTMYHAKKGSYALLQELALQNLHHPHDLMHKANGWLLREMGGQEEQALLDFLKKHYTAMPRTTLRYAIEKLEPALRQDFLKGRV